MAGGGREDWRGERAEEEEEEEQRQWKERMHWICCNAQWRGAKEEARKKERKKDRQKERKEKKKEGKRIRDGTWEWEMSRALPFVVF